jgi:hypothetical protein
MFMSPSDRIALAQGERNQQFQRDYAAAQVAAQPDPVTRAVGGAVAKIGGAALGALMPGAGALGGAGGSAAAVGGGGIISQRNVSAIMGDSQTPSRGRQYGRQFLANLGQSLMK